MRSRSARLFHGLVRLRAGRVSQPAARALASRIKLYMASPRFASESGVTWQQAADAAKNFIDTYGANFGLFAQANIAPEENYGNAVLFSTYSGANNETIFFRNDAAINWDGISQDTPVGEGGSGGNCPSQNLVDMYDMADGSSPSPNMTQPALRSIPPAHKLRQSTRQAATPTPRCGKTATRV